MECVHDWHCDKSKNHIGYYCILCGQYNTQKPDTFIEEVKEDEESLEEEKCRHVWECLQDRCHNKGNSKGKYKAYKCKLCQKFQRRY